MKKETFEIRLIEYLRGTLPANERKELESFLEKDVAARKQLEELAKVWEDFEQLEVPEPSPEMDQGFFQALDAEIIRSNKKRTSGSQWVNELLGRIFKPQLVYGVLILGLGILGGYLLNFGGSEAATPAQTVDTSDTQELREKLVLTLLEQSSANQRLQGVSEANKIVKVDERVINALLKTLNNDPNVNVRLAAIESLSNYVNYPLVRQGIIQSIPNQESPIIQVTLANLMLALEEKGSIESFKKLLEKEELDTTVKKKIESTIASII